MDTTKSPTASRERRARVISTRQREIPRAIEDLRMHTRVITSQSFTGLRAPEFDSLSSAMVR